MNWLTNELITSLNYTMISDDGVYGKCQNNHGVVCPGYGLMGTGKRIVYFNRSYGSDGLVFIKIREDGDSRTVFNGAIDNIEHFKLILNCVR